MPIQSFKVFVIRNRKTGKYLYKTDHSHSWDVLEKAKLFKRKSPAQRWITSIRNYQDPSFREDCIIAEGEVVFPSIGEQLELFEEE